MKYINLIDNKVIEIIPDFDSTFPNIPINERYPEDFCKNLIEVSDDENVEIGMYYDSDKGFYYPEIKIQNSNNIIQQPSISNLDDLKLEKISISKQLLSEWLKNNPMLYTDGKYYSVTEEKQSLLNSNLASYERATKNNIEYPLKWNSAGEECIEWLYKDLLTLSLSIAAYVAPKVSMQQNYEIQIRYCNTIEEIDSIVIDYNGNGDSSETNS